MSEEMKQCPGCNRHCDLSAPSCPRGEAYARGEVPAESGEHEHGNHAEHGHGHHGGHPHGHHGEHRRGRGEHRHGRE